MSSITTIVTFDMPAASADPFLFEWTQNNTLMRGQEGQTGGSFYRCVDQTSHARFVNVAHWASEEAMTIARSAAEVTRRDAGKDLAAALAEMDVTVRAQTFIEELAY